MWLSSTAQQALHAVLCIAGSGHDRPVRVDEIAAVIDCPRNYLSKTLHLLTQAGVLRSRRGPAGGFLLADPPGRLTLAQVIAPFEPASERRCLLGRPTCGDAEACAAHQRWACVARQAEEFFRTTTIAQLLGDWPTAGPAARARLKSLRRPQTRRTDAAVRRRTR